MFQTCCVGNDAAQRLPLLLCRESMLRQVGVTIQCAAAQLFETTQTTTTLQDVTHACVYLLEEAIHAGVAV